MNTQTNEIQSLEIQSLATPMLIVVRTSENYNSQTITATSKTDKTEYTGVVEDSTCIIRVKRPGEYIVSNSLDETTETAIVGDPFETEVYFTDYYGSINVTVPELLIGEKIVATNAGHVVEKEIKSTVEIVDVYYNGQWEVGIEGTELIEKKTITLTEVGDSQTVTFSADQIPYATVTLVDDLLFETVTLKKEPQDDFSRKKINQNGTVKFFLPEHATFKIGIEGTSALDKEVQVEENKEYQVEINLDELSIPVLIVKSKEEDNGKVIKVSKDETNLEKKLVNGRALFFLSDFGEYSIKCDDYPEITKTCNAEGNEVYRVTYRANIFGVKIIATESDPEKRVVYIDDCVGRKPVELSNDSERQTYTTNYNGWDKEWLFEKFYPVMLKTNGTVDYLLNPNDYSKRLDNGQDSDITNIDYDGNVMTCFEKVYLKFSMDGEDQIIEISEDEQEGFEPIGFYREDGSVADRIYISTYIASVKDSKARSISGYFGRTNDNLDNWRKYVQKLGSNYDLESYPIVQLENALFYIFTKTLYPKGFFGSNDSDPAAPGTTDKVGSIGYLPQKPGDSALRTKFLHLEDFFNKEGRFCVGRLGYNFDLYVKMKPPYSTTSVSDYEKVEDYVKTPQYNTTHHVMKQRCSNKYGRYPVAYNASFNTYEVAQVRLANESGISHDEFGASWGLSGFDLTMTGSSYSQGSIFARIVYIPPAE